MFAIRTLFCFLLFLSMTIGCDHKPEPSTWKKDESSSTKISSTEDEAVSKTLRWKFRKGEIYRWSPKWDIDLDISQKEERIRMRTSSTFDFDIVPFEVADDHFKLKFTLVRGRSRIESIPQKQFFEKDEPEPIVMEYDSLKDGKGNSFESSYYLLGRPYSVTVASSGKVSEIKVAPELLQMLKSLRDRSTTTLLFEPEAFNSFYFNGLIELPSEAPEEGMEWKQSITSPTPLAISYYQMNFTVKYFGPVEESGATLEWFSITPKFEFDENQTVFIRFGEQKSSGEMLFDRKQGLMVSSHWKLESELTPAVGEGGGKMIMSSSSTFRKKAADDVP